jgi:hypothetical protein
MLNGFLGLCCFVAEGSDCRLLLDWKVELHPIQDLNHILILLLDLLMHIIQIGCFLLALGNHIGL